MLAIHPEKQKQKKNLRLLLGPQQRDHHLLLGPQQRDHHLLLGPQQRDHQRSPHQKWMMLKLQKAWCQIMDFQLCIIL